MFILQLVNCFLLLTLWRITSQSPTGAPKQPGRLAVQVVRTSADFLRNSNQEKNQLKPQEEQSREPAWYFKNGKSKRGRRKKRRAHINHELVYISEFPTNTRMYRLCNKLGFFLRFHDDGKIDGTRNSEDKKSNFPQFYFYITNAK